MRIPIWVLIAGNGGRLGDQGHQTIPPHPHVLGTQPALTFLSAGGQASVVNANKAGLHAANKGTFISGLTAGELTVAGTVHTAARRQIKTPFSRFHSRSLGF